LLLAPNIAGVRRKAVCTTGKGAPILGQMGETQKRARERADRPPKNADSRPEFPPISPELAELCDGRGVWVGCGDLRRANY